MMKRCASRRPESFFAERQAALSMLSELAHAREVAIEGEVGELPMGVFSTGTSSHGGRLTEPYAAAAFVEQIDQLGCSGRADDKRIDS
jgi:hypothetical protein